MSYGPDQIMADELADSLGMGLTIPDLVPDDQGQLQPVEPLVTVDVLDTRPPPVDEVVPLPDFFNWSYVECIWECGGLPGSGNLLDTILAPLGPISGELGAAGTAARTILQEDGYYIADGLTISTKYYESLLATGRPAPFLTAREILETATTVNADPRGFEGFYQYSNDVLNMILNPDTGEIWHIGP